MASRRPPIYASIDAGSWPQGVLVTARETPVPLRLIPRPAKGGRTNSDCELGDGRLAGHDEASRQAARNAWFEDQREEASMSRRRHTPRPIPCQAPAVEIGPAVRRSSGRFLSRFHSRTAL